MSRSVEWYPRRRSVNWCVAGFVAPPAVTDWAESCHEPPDRLQVPADASSRRPATKPADGDYHHSGNVECWRRRRDREVPLSRTQAAWFCCIFLPLWQRAGAAPVPAITTFSVRWGLITRSRCRSGFLERPVAGVSAAVTPGGVRIPCAEQIARQHRPRHAYTYELSAATAQRNQGTVSTRLIN